MRHPRRSLVLLTAAVLALATSPAVAEAQRRAAPSRRPLVRPVVVLRSHVPPRRVLVRSWIQWGYPWGGYPPYGYYQYGRADITSSLRIDVTPREAEVFVNGYSAGLVDDFDGIFQRLRLPPGGYEIAIYLEGYRTIYRNIYLSPNSSHTIRDQMVPLAPGEPSEPPPVPASGEAGGVGESGGRVDDEPVRPAGRGYGSPRGRAAPQDRPASFGTLSIAVQPRGADLVIDDEPWPAETGEGRRLIRLTEGRHRIEVRADGFVTYTEDVLIRRGATLRLDVQLTRRGE